MPQGALNFYYQLKPYLPRRLRIATRRLVAKRTRRVSKDVWPIAAGAGTTPEGWPGWPGGKQFAFVLTHDVEGREGLAKCRELMELEMKLGFRSSFNFVPEGEYTVSRELRDHLTQNGFEVGVHDLHHDGKLFSNETDFSKKAERINRYLREWNASGFRAGFMLHNLDWIEQLDVLYDASTFDTDPFEPQPDGLGTIFPFWKSSQNGRGYVELPYTLVQDSTLFLLLEEPTTKIWEQKLDWVAQHGGMALVNVHPDYLCFGDESQSRRTYPIGRYRTLLEYARRKYGESFWQPLPKEVAAFARERKPPRRHRPRRICMLSYSTYETDNRVTRYAETLTERGDEVDVLTLRRSPDCPPQEQLHGVNVFRIQPRYGKTERSQLAYLLPVMRFLLRSTLWITRQHARKRYDLFHIHNPPDFLVLAAAYARVTGTPVILDIHDIVPELYASKFGKQRETSLIWLLRLVERACAKFASHVIIANHLWLEKYASRTGAGAKCSVFMNNVDTSIFHPRRAPRDDGKLIFLFPGSMSWHQGLDIAIRAIDKIRTKLPNAELHIYGDGNMKPSLMDLSRELGLEERVRFFDQIPIRQVAEVMASADVGIVPKRANSFGNEAYSTKIMEFMAAGVPVVASDTKIDRFYFDDSVVRFFESGNPDALAAAMVDVLHDDMLRQQMVARASEYVARNGWHCRKTEYLKLVDSLTQARGAS